MRNWIVTCARHLEGETEDEFTNDNDYNDDIKDDITNTKIKNAA